MLELRILRVHVRDTSHSEEWENDIRWVNGDQIQMRAPGTYKDILQYREGPEDKWIDVPIVDVDVSEK